MRLLIDTQIFIRAVLWGAANSTGRRSPSCSMLPPFSFPPPQSERSPSKQDSASWMEILANLWQRLTRAGFGSSSSLRVMRRWCIHCHSIIATRLIAC